MIVMKFGGTSVGSAAAIRQVKDIVASQKGRRPVVVVSAHAGVTDSLLELGRRAASSVRVDTKTIEQRHRDILRDLDLDPTLLDPLLKDLRDLVRGIRLVGEASKRAMDHLASFGERCSARTIAAYFSKEGMPALAVEAGEAGLLTDSNFGRARPLPDGGRLVRSIGAIEGVPVVTGFIGRDEMGNLTTLGRNGSDYSAALLGNALSAEEIQIWKDVDAVMTADPRIVKTARPIPTMSFAEASELSFYGSKVLHPATILPAMEKSIPVRVLNTMRPEAPGTRILPTYEEPGVVIRAVVAKRGVHLVNLISPRMLEQHGFLAKVFCIADRFEIDVDLVATSEVSISMTTDRAHNLDSFAAELAQIGRVTVEPRHALVCLVGQGFARVSGVAAQVLTTLAEIGVPVRAISQGAIKVNLALVLPEEEMERAVRALHDQFFPPGQFIPPSRAP